MKRVCCNTYRTLMLVVFSLSGVLSFAQDTAVSRTTITTKETTSTEFYMQPWVWVVGGAVLLIILVALFRGNSNTTTKTTVIKEDRRV